MLYQTELPSHRGILPVFNLPETQKPPIGGSYAMPAPLWGANPMGEPEYYRGTLRLSTHHQPFGGVSGSPTLVRYQMPVFLFSVFGW